MEAAVEISPSAPVPCLSILEGGYNLNAITASAAAHVAVLAAGYPQPRAPGDEVAALTAHMEDLGIFAGSSIVPDGRK